MTTFTYNQLTGELFYSPEMAVDELRLGVGYAGAGLGKNNPKFQHVKDVGPIPVGVYEIGPPEDTKAHGPHVLRLTPRGHNQMFGRAGFLIHGDSVSMPGTASQGCIILGPDLRKIISGSSVKVLEVVA